MSTMFTVVAIFRARAGQEAPLHASLVAMLEPSRREAGCLNYDLLRSNDDPALFFFHETWRSAAHHRAHLEMPHVQHLLAVSPEMLREPIQELKGQRIES